MQGQRQPPMPGAVAIVRKISSAKALFHQHSLCRRLVLCQKVISGDFNDYHGGSLMNAIGNH